MTSLTRLTAAFVGLAALALPTSVVFAQDYPLTGGELVIDGGDDGSTDTRLAAGDPLAIAGGGFAPGATVDITIESEPLRLGGTTADATGDIATVVTLPADFPAGSHTVKATGDDPSGGTLVLAQPVVVADETTDTGTDTEADTDTETATAGETLPRTGTSTVVLLAVAGLSLTGGTGGLIVARRRRSAA